MFAIDDAGVFCRSKKTRRSSLQGLELGLGGLGCSLFPFTYFLLPLLVRKAGEVVIPFIRVLNLPPLFSRSVAILSMVQRS